MITLKILLTNACSIDKEKSRTAGRTGTAICACITVWRTCCKTEDKKYDYSFHETFENTMDCAISRSCTPRMDLLHEELWYMVLNSPYWFQFEQNLEQTCRIYGRGQRYFRDIQIHISVYHHLFIPD